MMKGPTLREMRRRLGLTQLQLAERLDVDQSSVSRWERGIESPRPRRQAQLKQLLLRDEERRHMERCLASIRFDVKPAALADQKLRLSEISSSGMEIFQSRGLEVTKLIGMDADRYFARLGIPSLMTMAQESGVFEGDTLLFRFSVNIRGNGSTAIWEPILEDGRLVALFSHVSNHEIFAPNDDVSLERVDFVQADDPSTIVSLHRGERFDQLQ